MLVKKICEDEYKVINDEKDFNEIIEYICASRHFSLL